MTNAMRYRWKGSDERGDPAGGEVEAAGLLAAADALRARGVSASVLERAEPEPDAKPLGDLDAFAFFNESLGRLCAIGMPLPRAVAEISRGLRKGRFRTALERLEARLREGKSLAEASAELGADFDPAYRAMLRAGAASGDLPAVLGAVTRSSEGFRRVKRALVAAFAYPTMILAFSGVFLLAFAAVFVPLYEQMHRQFNLEPPPVLGGLIAAFRSPLLAASLLAGPIAALGLFGRRFVATPAGEELVLRLPLAGRVVSSLRLARFADALGLLLRARVPLADALPVALVASGSRSMEAAAPALAAKAAEGATLEQVLAAAPLVPAPLRTWFALAEREGRVPEASREAAALLTEQAAAGSETLVLVLLPLALLAAGLLLGGFIVSAVIPYYDLVARLSPS